jgi:hypothetical protein
MLQLFTYSINNLLPMSFVGPLLEVGIAAVAAGLILKRQAEEAALESEPIPVPVRDPR